MSFEAYSYWGAGQPAILGREEMRFHCNYCGLLHFLTFMVEFDVQAGRKRQ